MSRAQLQEKRNQLAAEIRDMADSFQSNGDQWPTSSDRNRWQRVNKNYDETVNAMDKDGDASVLDRASEVDRLQNAPAHPLSHRIGREDTIPQNRRTKERPQFVNAETGKPMRVMLPGESYAQVFGAKTEFDGEPVPRLGDVIASKLAGRPINLTDHQYSMNVTGVDTQGGFDVLPTLWPQVVDLYRAALVMVRAGAMQIQMTGPEMKILRLTGDLSANHGAEGTSITASSAAFGTYVMKARRVAAITSVSVEALEDTRNVASMIERSMSAALAQAIDQAALQGPGGNEESTGVIETDGINEVASVGTPADYSHLTTAVKEILEGNYSGDVSDLAWISHPRDGATYDGLVDSTGQPLQPTPWASQLQRLSTTALPTDGGGGSDESTAVVGDFSEVLLGTLGGVRFQTFDVGTMTDENGNTHNMLQDYKRALRMITRVDSAVLHPAVFTKMTGITE